MAYNLEYVALPGYRANSTGLATSQFLFGKIASTAGQVVLAGATTTTSIGTTVYGVIMNKPGANEEVEFAIAGVVKCVVGTSTVAIGDRLAINSTSKGTDAGVTDNGAFVARALTAGAAANDIITVMLTGIGGARY